MTIDTLWHYKLVFDVARAGYPYWWVPLTCLVMSITIGVLLIVTNSGAKRMHGCIALAVGPLVSLGILRLTYQTYARIRDALLSGAYVTVEGTVEEFRPGGDGDHVPERFVVWSDGVRHVYEYTPSQLDGGFDHTVAHGGPMRAGLHVRIADVNGRIARLEIAQPVRRQATSPAADAVP